MGKSAYLKALMGAQNHYCCYCHHEMPTDRARQTVRNAPTKDHVEPRCHGGKTVPDNLVMACAQCNQIRGAMDAAVFYDLLWHWFRKNATLRAHWHDISPAEFRRFKMECTRIHQVQWERRLKRCRAATLLHTLVPLPFLAQKARVY